MCGIAIKRHVNSEHIPNSIKRIYFEAETRNVLQHHAEAVQAHPEAEALTPDSDFSDCSFDE